MFRSASKLRARSTGFSTRLELSPLDDRSLPSTVYLATDLVSDQPGVAPITDPILVNAWGIALAPTTGAFRVSAAGSGLSEVYIGNVAGSPLLQPFKVTIPGGSPTGQVFNPTADFTVTAGGATAPAIFIFASESGAVTGWNPSIPPPPLSTNAQTAFQATDGAIYKGIALAQSGGQNFLYLADFHNGKIDVLDANYDLTQLAGTFTDPNLPEGFAPFNIASINGQLHVSYARQDADAVDDVAGRGNGFVSVFTTDGQFVRRLISRGALNSPWGMIQAPADFGEFGGALLVGNFGDGRIHAYNPNTGSLLGTLKGLNHRPLVIDGLWGLAFGNGVSAGDANALYYAAGPENEEHGLFGRITANPEGTNPVTAELVGDVLTITGSRDDDQVTVGLRRFGTRIEVRSGGDRIGEFDRADVGSIRFNGFAGDDVFLVSPLIRIPTLLDGGAGNDLVTGGSGNNILLGGLGSDFLVGLGGRDILIGGDGRDVLLGGGGDDLLIGGSTVHDSNAAALIQIQGEWTSPGSYNTRVARLRGGDGGLPKLDSSTVIDDGVRDDLIGFSGLDWFFAADPDVIHDRRSGEQVN
jgi:uncharacterized protein (TIGR03118 family)